MNGIKHHNNVINIFLFKMHSLIDDSNNSYLTSDINKIIKKHIVYCLDLFNNKSFKYNNTYIYGRNLIYV